MGGAGDLLAHVADGLDGFPDPLAAGLRGTFGRGRGLRCGGGVARHFVDCRTHLVDRRCGHLDLVVLAVQRAVAFLGDRVQLLGGRGELGGRAADLFDGVVQVLLHGLKGLHQPGRFVAPGDVELPGEVALGHLFRRAHGFADRQHDAVGQQPGDGDAAQHRHQHHRHHRPAGVFEQVVALTAGRQRLLADQFDQRRQTLQQAVVAGALFVAHQFVGLFGLVAPRQFKQCLVAVQVFPGEPEKRLEQPVFLWQYQQRLIVVLHLRQVDEQAVHMLLEGLHGGQVPGEDVVHFGLAELGQEHAHLPGYLDTGQPDLADPGGGVVDGGHAVAGEQAEADQQQGDDGETCGRAVCDG
ncbi:hypothetical protein D3C84_577260 [compost metagenome]